MTDIDLSKISNPIEEPTDGIYKKVSLRVDEWLSYRRGEPITFDAIVKYHNWFNCPNEAEIKKALSQKLWYESNKKEPILQKKGRFYRVIERFADKMDWQSADPKNTVPLKFPFGIERYSLIYPKSIVIVAGSKQAGKTCLLYNFIEMNMGNFIIDLFNSETGKEQMKVRFLPLNIPDPAPFEVYERYDNFADVINPDHISVIDYLDLDSEVYLVGAEINAIFQKLKTGVAIIGLQKPPPTVVYEKGVRKVYERDLAYGGGFTAKRAILYITMGSNKLKLLYVKTPANPKVNPNNMSFSFGFHEDGIHFINVKQFYSEEEVEGELDKQEEIPF